MTNRLHIDAPAGVIDVEGEVEFVEGVLDKFFPLLEKSKFGSHPNSAGQDPGADADEREDVDDRKADEGGKSKTRRKRGNAPPKGQSCADRILVLKGEKFFKNHKTVSEIVDGLKVKGWTHNNNQVGAALTNMFGRGDIQRTKEGGSAWKYFWDRG